MTVEWSEESLYELLAARFGDRTYQRELQGEELEEERLKELEARVHDLCHAQRLGPDVEWFFEPADWGERGLAMDALLHDFKKDWGEFQLFDEETATAAVEIEVYRRLGLTPPWRFILETQALQLHTNESDMRYELELILTKRAAKEVDPHARAVVDRLHQWLRP